jgi:A/G-specific adenine glycosylase
MSEKRTPSLISREILRWYARHKRDLPWRNTRNPYCIWISEVMLQQTQVDTVIPYYKRFLSRFPSVKALASAPVDDVLKCWENMGYYARARNLHTAAQQLMERFGGELPHTRDDLSRLPGIGSYTAGAILSIAFGQPVPAVDGNVRRVLSRLFAITEPLDQSQTQCHLMNLAEQMISEKDPGTFNQALMDLGSQICTPRKPNCGLCPARTSCKALRHDLQDLLPVARKRGPLPHRNVTAGVLWNEEGRVLIVRRPLGGLLGGLWKFPGGLQNTDEPLAKCLRKNVRDELGIRIKVGKSIASVDHAYTHFRITLHAFQCAHRGGDPKRIGCANWRWIHPHQYKNLAFSKADREIMKAAIAHGRRNGK